ncbi:MAG: DUF2914 domain-containing protein [Sandaracinaceae bacterium]|nr:DUF2914 domain-containing protein [Sandaracinaceae bacterium]
MTSIALRSYTRTVTFFATALAALSLSFASVASAQDAELRVTEMTTARGYEAARGAVDATTSFHRADGRVFVVIRIENPSGAEQDITVAFERAEGTPATGARGGVTLHVPASRRYRTVARTSTSRAPGRWRAVVRNAEGEVLQTVEFDIAE